MTKRDEDLIKEAAAAAGEEQYIVAGNILKKVDPDLLEDVHRRWITMGDQATQAMKDLLEDPDENPMWTKQGESHGNRDTMIHYNIDDELRLTCRVETPIESSLLIPFLSCCNESELFTTWMPRWKYPAFGIQEAKKKGEWGRGHQLIYMYVQLPFPMSDRVVDQHVFAVDSIDADNCIVIKARGQEAGAFDGLVEESPKKAKRLDLDAAFTIRPCPKDHFLLQNSKGNYPSDEKLILLSMEQSIDAHVSYVPQSLQNFFARTFMGTLWGNLLKVAEEVRDNKRPELAKAIAEKSELYDWVRDRVQVMFDKIEDE